MKFFRLESALGEFSFDKKRPFFLLALALSSLMFFQSSRQFVAAVYFNTIQQGTFSLHALSGLLVFLSPLLLLFLRRIDCNLLVLGGGVLLILHRLYGALSSEPMLYQLFHGTVIVAFGIYLPCFLKCYNLLLAKHTSQGVMLAETALAPAFALLLTIFFDLIGDSYDITVYGWTLTDGTTFTPFWLLLPLALFAFYCLGVSYEVTKRELGGSVWIQPSGTAPLKFLIQGVAVGCNLSLLLFLLISPAAVARWSGGDVFSCSIITASSVALFLFLLQFSYLYPYRFHKKERWKGVALSNSFLLFFMVDLLFIQSGSTDYLLGIALWAILCDISVLFRSHSSINLFHFMQLIFIAQLTFLLLLFFSLFTIFHAYVHPSLLFLKDRIRSLFLLMTLFSTIIPTILAWRQREERAEPLTQVMGLLALSHGSKRHRAPVVNELLLTKDCSIDSSSCTDPFTFPERSKE